MGQPIRNDHFLTLYINTVFYRIINMKKSNSQLNAVETSDVYKLINKVCWHLANDVSDAPKETSAKKQKFAELRRLIRAEFLTYDRETKLARLNKDIAVLDKYLTVKRMPKAFQPSTSKTKRI
jgi:hypothetical protein